MKAPITAGPDNAIPATASFAMWSRIGHDLRQPIQSLLLLTHVMSSASEASLRQQTGRNMEDALLTLQDMLDTVAIVARLEAGLESIQWTTCSVPEVVDRVARHLGGAFDLRLKSQPAMLMTDMRLLERVITGLVHNAAKVRTGGPITLSCRSRRHGIHIDVAYDGPAPEASSALFIDSTGGRNGQTADSRRMMGQVMSLAPGLPLLVRLAHHLGGRLEIRDLAKSRAGIALYFPPPKA